MTVVVARAPGRVNLIGEHTDTTGGLVLPMAVDRDTVVRLEPGGRVLRLTSVDEPEPVRLDLADPAEPSTVRPAWGRYVAAVAAVVGARVGGRGRVRTDIPIGAGLSSSAALEVAVALALGFEGTTLELARACQEAEQLASGVPCGIMDQLASAAGVDGHALLIDCRSLEVEPVPVPDDLQVVVVDSGQRRTLDTSAYAVRRSEFETAERAVGALRGATAADVARIDDPLLRRRARHVTSENERVRAAVDALRAGDHRGLGGLLFESHRSLRDDAEVSTPVLDDLVDALSRVPGVHGARLVGAGFGGCCVALTEPGVTLDLGTESWVVRPSAGASIAAAPPPGHPPEVL